MASKQVPKNVWGPVRWYELHTMAINYSVNPAQHEKIYMHSRFWHFIHSLPCDKCRMHAMEYSKTYPPDLTGSREFQTWAWRFHNAVNKRLKKPLITSEKYHHLYKKEIDLSYIKFL